MTAVRRAAGAVLALLATALAAGETPPLTYQVEPALTNAGFSVAQFGVLRQYGRFERIGGTIVLDPDGDAGRVDLAIATASVTTGWEARDDFIRGESMFDAARYPEVRFRSLRLDYVDARLVGVDGEVTLRGVTRPMHLDVHDVQCGLAAGGGRDGCRARVVGRLSRAAFGMHFGYPLIGDDVEFDFAIMALRAP